MSFTLTGRIIHIGNIQTFNSTTKREFVISVQDGQYTQDIKLQTINAKTSITDGYKLGQDITVHFNINGRKWEKDGKVDYFVNLNAWKIEGAANATPEPDATTTSNLPF